MPSDAPALPALAARAQLGDRGALEALLRALSPGLRAHLAYMLSQSADIDDALQETLWIIVKRLGTLRDAPLVRAWAYRIATREALRLMRGAQRLPHDELTEADTIAAADPEDDVFAPELRSAVRRHVESLPKKAGTVVRLRFLEGLSQQEIAEALEIPLGTVKSRLAYGLQQLRTLLDAPQSTA